LRQLIVNADDFGLTLGVNRAIVEARQRGVVTSATVMANSSEFENAIALAKSNSQLEIGCHVVLVDGQPILSRDQVPTLYAAQHDCFRKSLAQFALDVALGRIDPKQIAEEAAAQISKIQNAGIAISHFDTHKHVHVLPQILKPLLQAARSCGVPTVRNPFEPLRFSLLHGHFTLWKQFAKVRLLHSLAAQFRRTVSHAGLKTCDGTIGIVTTGFLDHDLLRRMIEFLPEGAWELVCHPGYNDAQLDAVTTRLRESRAQELAILTSGKTRALLENNGIQLISYRDLP
jgi:hopanoid biosynthesis associated protein HpnK